MNRKLKTLLAAAGLVVALAGAASTANADTHWQARHPWREQVNNRLATQDYRIHHERREGDLSAGQAYRLHRADARIRGQERWFAFRHGGHITRAEQMRLNHEENRVSHRIG
jgi:hypothetical protein